jgi:cysteine synthase cysKM2
MTSGNTGIAFSALGTFTGHPVHIFMPDWASEERKKLMAMYGATLHLISREAGGFNAALQGARDLAEEIGGFQPKQFENQDNPEAHYLTTGVEILRQLPDVTDFVAGVGSGGTLMGTARRLKADHAVRAVAVEPDAVPLLSGGTVKGAHHIEGIGDDFIPAVVDQTLVDGVMDINDLDAIAMAAKFGRVLGLGVGISSGANFLGSVIQNLEPGRKVATVFADDSKKYLTTMLSNPPAETADMWSSRIELLDYEPVETL